MRTSRIDRCEPRYAGTKFTNRGHGPLIVNASRRFCSPLKNRAWTRFRGGARLGDSVAFHLQMWSPEYRAENTLQSDNATSYFINAYIFMAKTTFIQWFLHSICVVIWIYFVYFSPWCVRIWRKDLVNIWGDQKVAGFMSLSVLFNQDSGAIY